MAVLKIRTGRYWADCDLADCPWTTGPYGLRLVISQRYRHHMKQAHDLDVVERETEDMKVQKDTELPEQSQGAKLSDYSGQLVVFAKGWEEATRGTKYGQRNTIDVHLYAYDTARKGFVDVGQVSVFFATVQKRLIEEGPDDDIGGVLTQGTDRNSREWDITPPSAAQVKLLDKFDPDNALTPENEEPF